MLKNNDTLDRILNYIGGCENYRKHPTILDILDETTAEKDAEIERLTALLKPFADGYERADFKCSWASNYTHADAYKNAYNGLKQQP